jgi:hypothetical protein
MFDFTGFVRKIHEDRSRPIVQEEDPFILPAYYGGELPPAEEGDKFKALVVLQNPLFTYTKEQWVSPCSTVEQAIKTHRQIFFSWLPRNPHLLELLHHILGRMPATSEEFFRLVYVTDIWKDAKDTNDVHHRKKDREYGRYWCSQLKAEIEGVAAIADGVIFIGAEARKAGFSPLHPGMRYRDFVFPDWGHKKEFQNEFEKFKVEGWKVKTETGDIPRAIKPTRRVYVRLGEFRMDGRVPQQQLDLVQILTVGMEIDKEYSEDYVFKILETGRDGYKSLRESKQAVTYLFRYYRGLKAEGRHAGFVARDFIRYK